MSFFYMILRMSCMTWTLRPVLLGAALASVLMTTACGGGASTDGATVGAGGGQGELGTSDPTPAETAGPDAAVAADVSESVGVVAAFYPLEFLATKVGGDRVEVTGLTPPGVEAHDLEITPRALIGLTDTDLVIALAGFQPAVDEALAGVEVPVVDLAPVADRPYGETEDAHSDEETHSDEEVHAEGGEQHSDEEAPGDEHSEGAGHGEQGDTDPHFWLDPTHMVEAAQVIATALAEVDPDGADVYAANAEALSAELTEVDEEARTAFASCDIDTLVTAHDAFRYFGDRYGFEIQSINGLSPDQEPDARTLAELSDFVAQNNIQTVYTETLVASDIADTVAAEAGVQTAVLDPIEGLTDASAGSDYLEVMRTNIDTVLTGQACT